MSKRQKTLKVARITVGSLLLMLGIVAIPYPGPGWLIVFAALAILARDFEWAQRALDYTKSKYDAWQVWLKKQPLIVKAIIWTATALIVIATIYLLNGYGLLNEWFNLGQDWLQSPLFKK